MANALWITLIGMGLVFVAILLLWGLMALIVRVTADKETPAAEIPAAVESETPTADGAAESAGRKRRAAAAGVAIAMALANARSANGTARAREAGSVSAWQAVHRAGRLGQQMNASRKKVVR